MRDESLGRRRGYLISVAELQLYELQGWSVIDDLIFTAGKDENGYPLVLMQPPAVFMGGRLDAGL